MSERKPHPRAWSAEDDAFLREHYAARGAKFCAERLGRSTGAVHQHACIIGLKGVPRVRSDGIKTLDDIRDRCRIEEDTGCWRWGGFVDRDGAAHGRVNGKGGKIARASFEFAKGPVRAGWIVFHACANSDCCNPAHLRAGTKRMAAQAFKRNGRLAHGLAQAIASLRNRRMVVPEETVQAIRRRVAAGERPSHLATEYGIHAAHACRIARGEARRAVMPAASVFSWGG